VRSGVEISDDVAHVFLRHIDGNLHDRFEDDRIGFSHSLFERHGTGDLECHFRGVDSWKEPSYSVQITSTTGYPASTPESIAT
jgi:hypothetical protein